VKKTNVGGATPVCAAYRIRTCARPGLAGGWAAVTSATNLFNSGVFTRVCRDAVTRSIASSSLGARSPVNAEMWRIGA